MCARNLFSALQTGAFSCSCLLGALLAESLNPPGCDAKRSGWTPSTMCPRLTPTGILPRTLPDSFKTPHFSALLPRSARTRIGFTAFSSPLAARIDRANEEKCPVYSFQISSKIGRPIEDSQYIVISKKKKKHFAIQQPQYFVHQHVFLVVLVF